MPKSVIKEYKEIEYAFGSGEVPAKPQPGEMFVFYGPEGDIESVDFLCPCGCGSTCYTPLVPEGTPRHTRQWMYKREPSGSLTLIPSIRYTGGCFAHFNITDGKVIMHGDSGVKC